MAIVQMYSLIAHYQTGAHSKKTKKPPTVKAGGFQNRKYLLSIVVLVVFQGLLNSLGFLKMMLQSCDFRCCPRLKVCVVPILTLLFEFIDIILVIFYHEVD